jgi:hypothetical protein
MRLKLDRSGPWIAVAGLCVLLWVSISTTLYAPWWGVALVLLLIVPQVVLVKRLIRTHPAQSFWVPVVGLFVWFGVVMVGAHWWGWSP